MSHAFGIRIKEGAVLKIGFEIDEAATKEAKKG